MATIQLGNTHFGIQEVKIHKYATILLSNIALAFLGHILKYGPCQCIGKLDFKMSQIANILKFTLI